MSNRPQTTALWIYFTKVPGDKLAHCKLCSKVCSYRTSITNLKTHLKNRHIDDYVAFLEKNKAYNPDKYKKQATTSKNHDRSLVETETMKDNKFVNNDHKISINTSMPIWKHFLKVADKRGRCNYCFKTISYKTTITNLKIHLQHKHPYFYSILLKEISESKLSKLNDGDPLLLIIKPESDQNLTSDKDHSSEETEDEYIEERLLNHKDFIEVSQEYYVEVPQQEDTHTEIKTSRKVRPRTSVYIQENKRINAMLLKLVAKTYQPFSIIQEPDFVDFVKALNPNYELPDHKMLSTRLVPNLYKRCLEEQKRMLHQETVTISLAICCFSTIKTDACISVTAHFINNNLEFKSVLLKWSEIKGKCSSSNLAIILSNTCKEWGILDKVNFCVTDNTDNLVEAVNSLGWMHCSCMARKLNLNLQDSLGIFDDILQKVRNVVTYYRSNSNAKENLMEYQAKILSSGHPLKLINSMSTRWTSTYFMITRFVRLKDAIKATMSNMDVDLPKITEDEWDTLKHLSIVLKPFNEATKELNAEKYLCASKAIAVINGLKDVISEMKRKSAYFDALNIIECIETQLNANFQGIEYEDCLALCTILDPRYKTSMFIDENAAEGAKISLVSKIFNLITAVSNTSSSAEPESETAEIDNDISLWRRRNAILAKQKIDPTQKLLRQAQQEVELYLQDDYASNDCNPCEWWRTSGQQKYPHLCELFKTSCNLVATVPNERYTSQERKSHFSIKKTEQLVFLNNCFPYYDIVELMS